MTHQQHAKGFSEFSEAKSEAENKIDYFISEARHYIAKSNEADTEIGRKKWWDTAEMLIYVANIMRDRQNLSMDSSQKLKSRSLLQECYNLLTSFLPPDFNYPDDRARYVGPLTATDADDLRKRLHSAIYNMES